MERRFAIYAARDDEELVHVSDWEMQGWLLSLHARSVLQCCQVMHKVVFEEWIRRKQIGDLGDSVASFVVVVFLSGVLL